MQSQNGRCVKQQQKSFRTEEKPQWGTGVYFLPDPDRTAIISIHNLPNTPDTLLLRLLGRGQVQADAISELIKLPSDHPYRGEILRHISRLQINLKIRQNRTKDIREVMMNLAPAYDKWLEETRTQEREETQIAIALRLMKKSMSLDDISECTGLSIEVLQALRANNSVR
jgi:predicted HTH domain antitoxin